MYLGVFPNRDYAVGAISGTVFVSRSCQYQSEIATQCSVSVRTESQGLVFRVQFAFPSAVTAVAVGGFGLSLVQTGMNETSIRPGAGAARTIWQRISATDLRRESIRRSLNNSIADEE